MKRKILFLLAIFHLGTCIYPAENKYVFRQLISGNELSQGWITSITQDELGFMWFGTSDGLYRYDGYEFKVYRSITGVENTLIGNNISLIYEDKKGNLWIATNKGICLYNRETDSFIEKDTWPKINISDIVEDSQGRLYLGSFIGFFRFSPDKEVFEYFIDKNQSSRLNPGNQKLFISRSGLLLMNGSNGFYKFNQIENRIEPLFVGSEFTGNLVTSIIEDYKGNIWIGYRDGGLYLLEKNNLTIPKRLNLPTSHYLTQGTILSILETSDSVLWIGTENNGLALIDLKKFYRDDFDIVNIVRNISDPTTLCNNSVYALREDIQKNIWIGTYSGLNFFNEINNNFHHQRFISETKGSLSDNSINCFFEEGEKIWIGSEKGINILDRKSETYTYLTYDKRNPNSLSSNAVWAITKDRDGNFWIGTWAGGLNKYNPKTGNFTHFVHSEDNPKSISSNNIFSIITDESGVLWIGTMGGGLNRFNPKTNEFKSFVHDNVDSSTISNDWVRQVFIDSRNRMWVSNYISVDIFDHQSESFHHFYHSFNNPAGISDIGAISIFEDSKKNIWFATESGLNLFNEADSGFTKYQVKDGLPSNTIQAILEDEEGNLWLSTNNGISKFINGINHKESPFFVNFDVHDGLQGNMFNGRSSLKTSDGCLFFGGKNGYNDFYPEKIARNNYIPPVIFTGFKVLNKEVVPGERSEILKKHISIADKVNLKYSQSVFSISFSALNYLIPEKNQYSYMLEGFEENWNNAGSGRSVTYTNLDPGEYIFKVKASNNDGVWNTNGKSLKIIIHPPWYRSILAYLLYFLSITGVVLLYRRSVILRTRLKHQLVLQNMEKEKLNQINQMKTGFFTNISHEFRTPLTLIISPVESLLSDVSLKNTVLQQLSIIQKNARRLLRLINQLLDISAIETDHLRLKVSRADIVQYIGEIVSLFRWLATQNEIDFSFTTNKETCICYFDSDKIEKICYNLLANAFKYTPVNGRISVELEIIEDNTGNSFPGNICIKVKDNGIGITAEEQKKIFEQFYRAKNNDILTTIGTGIGLSLVNGLVNVYRGQIKIESKVGTGSEFSVWLPLEERFFNPDEIDNKENRIQPITVDIYDLEHDLDKKTEGILGSTIDKTEEKTTVLIVEDNLELRDHLSDKFSQKYKVFVASNGSEALSVVHTSFPDIIITDIRMPVMDGLELCHKLKNDETTSHIPVILLTAKAGNEDRYEGVSVGADAYITKPFDTKVLLATVKNLIETRRQLREKYKRNLVVEPSDIEIISVDEKFIKKAIVLVEKYIADPDFSVDIFSREIGMSRSHLHRKLVGLTGHSPSGFIRTIRMKRAAQFLTRGKLTVSEVLFEVGIKSRSYFTKSFKEQFGVAPTDYEE